MRWSLSLLLLSSALPVTAISRQQDEAERLFREQAWEGAAKAYEAIVKADPENGRAWLRLGIAREALGSYPEAIAAIEKANAVLRSEPRFEEVVARAKANAEPCEHIAEFRQFDFWIGDWNVTSAGQLAGTNHVEKHENGCFLMENWVSVNAGTGKSMNFYDPVEKKWNQIWVDSSGSSIAAKGGIENGAMHFEGDHHYPDGNQERFRMTFTPRDDGSVRQFIEQSKDGGGTWYVWFDGIYQKKP